MLQHRVQLVALRDRREAGPEHAGHDAAKQARGHLAGAHLSRSASLLVLLPLLYISYHLTTKKKKPRTPAPEGEKRARKTRATRYRREDGGEHARRMGGGRRRRVVSSRRQPRRRVRLLDAIRAMEREGGAKPG